MIGSLFIHPMITNRILENSDVPVIEIKLQDFCSNDIISSLEIEGVMKEGKIEIFLKREEDIYLGRIEQYGDETLLLTEENDAESVFKKDFNINEYLTSTLLRKALKYDYFHTQEFIKDFKNMFNNFKVHLDKDCNKIMFYKNDEYKLSYYHNFMEDKQFLNILKRKTMSSYKEIIYNFDEDNLVLNDILSVFKVTIHEVELNEDERDYLKKNIMNIFLSHYDNNLDDNLLLLFKDLREMLNNWGL